MNTINKNLYAAWNDKTHAKYFDGGYNLNLRGLKKVYESYNEVKLFLNSKSGLLGNQLLEVGCATGEFLRYIDKYHNEFDYFGVDISKPAIERAKEKYPDGNLFCMNENLLLSETLNRMKIKPSILYARDVVLHQTNPFEFLQDIISIPSELAIFRIRTRDKGVTVLNPELSCQYHYNKWVPYMVLNIDEVIAAISSQVHFESLYIIKNYQQLGGHTNRYLPKECYYPETGTAETSCAIKISENKVEKPKIIIEEVKDSNASFNLFDYKLDYIIKRVRKMLFK
jgi:SAM-dependent methyltransferase